MRLADYLTRIGFEGEPRPDRETLEQLQRRHHLAIAYENLDVQLGRPLTPEPAAAFDKIVRRRRGGWCYEMNGVMGWALTEIGFSVTRLAGAVMRSVAGDDNIGNHLVLRVDLPEGPMLADVGLGDGPFAAYPLREGPFRQRGQDYRIERLQEGWWRIHSPDIARPPNFDIHPEFGDEALLARKCAQLQSDPASLFVQTLICQRFTPDGHVDLIGKVLRRIGPDGVSEHTLGSAGELTEVLATVFDLVEPEAARLWPAVCARHAAVFGA